MRTQSRRPPSTPPLPAETRRALAHLHGELPGLMLRDERRLRKRLDGVRRERDPQRLADALAGLSADVAEAAARLQRRRETVPVLRYPEQLPVSQRRDDLLAAIRDHQVVVVAGETGSGKTTQLPKLCLELGRGVRGMIGHTQPRRIAARSVAERIAEELGVPLGDAVGYAVRFTDRVSEQTLVKLMTDGILLAEIQSDRMLSRYDTLIIDEAHERSLNVDFLLGYLQQLLPRRPDLKVIVTSATIDPEAFARHFGGAPVIEVSGRTYPVELRYRPLVPDAGSEDDPDGSDDPQGPLDQTRAVCEAVQELSALGPGDILVFLSGEREIRDTADALAGVVRPGTEILPLYARLSAAEQHRVFAPHAGRRIVLATNVAETSLTVPGIRYVVDAGTARISRYSHRTKVQRLPIEPISQASANQRSGRCGRLEAGVAIRLYSQDDYRSRPQFTDPEILRTNLASVVLQLASLGLGDLGDFPLVDPPDRRAVADGVRLLEELGALDPMATDPRHRLTPLGRRLAQLPIDPRLGRMVLEADRLGCLREVIIVTAALSIQDPRERPVDRQQAADELHRRFADPESDFLGWLNLWEYLEEQQRELSSSRFRRLCAREFLHYLRVREWQDLVGQLRQVARGLGLKPNRDALGREPGDVQHLHTALLSGVLSQIGLREAERNDYLGARGARFAVFPGSALFRKPPRWVMAAELVETSRLWARQVGRIEPEWAEALAGHLVKRSYSEPHWEQRQGAVMAYEKVTLYGVPLVASRKVGYAAVDPVLCRELFIRHALVEGDWQTRHAFFHANRSLLDEVGELEERVRRRDILVDDQALFDFYDVRIPAEVVSGRHFDSWWKRARRERPDLLDFTAAMLVSEQAGEVRAEDYPDHWRQGELEFPLSYQFEPGDDRDGVTVHLPLAVLNQVSPAGFDWQIPGLRAELVTALIRSLPKALRRSFVPAPDHARAVLEHLPADVPADPPPLTDAVGGALTRLTGVVVPSDAWDLSRVPEHLRITFRVLDEGGKVLAEGKDLVALQARLRPKLRAAISGAARSVERRGLKAWTFDRLPRSFAADGGAVEGRADTSGGGGRGRPPVQGYPALVDEGSQVSVRVLATPDEQEQAMRAGTRRLLLLALPSPVRSVVARLPNQAKLALSHAPHAGPVALFDDCLAAAVDSLVAEAGGPAWDRAGFERLKDQVGQGLPERLAAVVEQVWRVLALAGEVQLRVRAIEAGSLQPAAADLRGQLAELVYPGFVAGTGFQRLPDLVRYLQAAGVRLDRLPDAPQRDLELQRRVELVQESYADLIARLPPGRPVTRALREIRWMIEELRVSFFAQPMRTAYPVSEQRIARAMAQATAPAPAQPG